MTGTQDLAPDLAPVVACLLITARGHGVDVLLSPDMTTIGGLLDAARLASLRLADDVVVWLDRDAQLRRWRPPNPAVSRLAWPRERRALEDIRHLLNQGTAGLLEDVLRIS